MCFTMGMSAFFGTLSFASALYEYKCFKSVLYSVGLAYWGVMEWLQAIQHLYVARPEDDFAMCKDPTNMFLTNVGGFHILFQPFFLSILIMSMYRRHDITARIEADLISKLCLAMVFWYISDPWFSIFMGGPTDAPSRGTEDCPNYMWLKEGYDAFLGKATPNLPGRPCTYYAPTRTGHLAWAAPVPLEMYFSPGNSVHFFMFFAPYFVMFKRPFVQVAAILLCITGPIMAQKVTPSVNEQPAIWCVFSVAQQIIFTITVRWKKLYKQPILEKIHHEGIFDEQPLTYYRSAQAAKDEACAEVEAPLPCKFTKHV